MTSHGSLQCFVAQERYEGSGLMGTLTLELSDEQLQKLERFAQKRGTSIQALMISMINDFAAQIEVEADVDVDEIDDNYDVTQDPIYNIKSHETGAPADLSLQHDTWLI
jgi:hypothetical protein